jgi:hypothetical protein
VTKAVFVRTLPLEPTLITARRDKAQEYPDSRLDSITAQPLATPQQHHLPIVKFSSHPRYIDSPTRFLSHTPITASTTTTPSFGLPHLSTNTMSNTPVNQGINIAQVIGAVVVGVALPCVGYLAWKVDDEYQAEQQLDVEHEGAESEGANDNGADKNGTSDQPLNHQEQQC